MKVVAPCKDCEDRVVNCHSTCDKYISWKKLMKENNGIICRKRQLDCAFIKRRNDAIRKMKKNSK